MKFRCLVLDHDETIVKSTADIHYPSFVQALNVLRPTMKTLSLEEYVSYCFNPGFSELCKDILNLNKEEQDYQYKVWKAYTETKTPAFYPGIAELIMKYKEAGGLITVVSHSESEQISRHYRANCGIVPDLIFGWELGEQQRKPHPYPIIEIMKRLGLQNHEMLVVDDMKPGLDMARSCSVPFAGAGWSHTIPEIRAYMKSNSDYYFPTVEAFGEFILAV